MKLRFIKLTFFFLVLFLFSLSTVAKDKWISIRSTNFHLVGNASEKEMKRVATKLEQFDAIFRLLFPKVKFTQSIETNVVVFKNKKTYKPFLPKRRDGKSDELIGGYFQPGEDVNYITLSTSGNREFTYEVIFHEYIHFLVNTNIGRSAIPPWYNEGLAGYYQTLRVKGKEVHLGLIKQSHLDLLRANRLMPLEDFFSLDNRSLHSNEDNSRNIFYAQAWAFIHYMTLTNRGGEIGRFLNARLSGIELETAFKQVFKTDFRTMETDLKKYINQKRFKYLIRDLESKMEFEGQMKVTTLTEAEANSYKGDLLFHMNELGNAEPYVLKALSLDPDQSLANTTLGLIRMRQKKFDESKKFLAKAISSNRKNHLAHYYYAYALSRESVDDAGLVTGYPEDTAEVMRKSLIEAINIKPNFTESYRLLAFINLVNNEKLDQAIKYLSKAISLQPGNQEYSLSIARIYMRQRKFDEAAKIANVIAKSAGDARILSQAQSILGRIDLSHKNADTITRTNNRTDESVNRQSQQYVKKKNDLSEAEIKTIKLENQQIDWNKQLEKLKAGEKRIVGYTQKVECLRGGIKYSIKTENGIVFLRSKDFQELDLLSLTENANNALISCNADMREFKTVFTFIPGSNRQLKTSGNLVAMAYVSDLFQLKTREGLAAAKRIQIIDEDAENAAKLKALEGYLRKPQVGEKRIIGTVEKIECHKKSMFFRVNVEGKLMRFRTDSPETLRIRIFTSDANAIEIGCGAKPSGAKSVITYRPNEKPSKKSNGEAVSVEFVPQDFQLNSP